MGKAITHFFKELFKTEVGNFNPEANKIRLQDVLYWIIGLVLSLFIPVCLVYLETWEFAWNVFVLLLGKNTETLYANGLYRLGYFICGICGNVLFLITGFCTTFKINGNEKGLMVKVAARLFCVICLALFLIFFIIANIIY